MVRIGPLRVTGALEPSSCSTALSTRSSGLPPSENYLPRSGCPVWTLRFEPLSDKIRNVRQMRCQKRVWLLTHLAFFCKDCVSAKYRPVVPQTVQATSHTAFPACSSGTENDRRQSVPVTTKWPFSFSRYPNRSFVRFCQMRQNR